MHTQRKLRNFLIDRDFQFKYIFWLTASGLLLVLLNAAIFYSYVHENYEMFLELTPMSNEARELLTTELREIVIRLVALSVVFIGGIGVVGLVLSHRAAGPMYAFRRVFRQIREGNAQARIQLRPKDHFQQVAAEFNQMMDSIQQKGGKG